MRKRPAPRFDAGACTNKREKFLIMEMFGKTLCITFDELVRSGIMSKSNFDKHVRERKFQVLQKGGNGRKQLCNDIYCIAFGYGAARKHDAGILFDNFSVGG